MTLTNYKEIACVLALAVIPTCANAENYAELSYISIHGKSTVQGNNISTRIPAMGLFVGTTINDNLAVEGLVGLGLDGGDVKINGSSQSDPVTQKFDYFGGLFLKPKWKLSENFEIYSRLGYVTGKTTASNTGGSASSSESDWSYGLGVAYQLTKTKSVTFGWMNLYDKSQTKVGGWMVGLRIDL